MSNRLALVITLGLFFNILGQGLIYLRLNHLSRLLSSPSASVVSENSSQILAQLTSIQDQLNRLSSPILGAANPLPPGSLSDLLPDIPPDQTATSSSPRYINVSGTSPVSVYKEQADFSPVIGSLQPGHKYSYSAKINDWYQVSLPAGQSGWTQGPALTEIRP